MIYRHLLPSFVLKAGGVTKFRRPQEEDPYLRSLNAPQSGPGLMMAMPNTVSWISHPSYVRDHDSNSRNQRRHQQQQQQQQQQQAIPQRTVLLVSFFCRGDTPHFSSFSMCQNARTLNFTVSPRSPLGLSSTNCLPESFSFFLFTIVSVLTDLVSRRKQEN